MHHAEIQKQYDEALRITRQLGSELPEYCHAQSEIHQTGLWRDYLQILKNSNTDFTGIRVIDFGCKFGHLAPLVKAMGAAQYIGVDAEEDYIGPGRRLFSTMYPESTFSLTHEGLIDLQPETADFVLMNEVISHVNPSFLDIVWREVARVLKPGGALFISDGNNSANPVATGKLRTLYEQWENGPEGTRTDRDVVIDHFLEIRRRVIRSYDLSLPEDRVEFIARNTSGLFGDQLRNEVVRHVKGDELILRPYVRGEVPVNPGNSGVVMERGFHPRQLELALAEYGFEAHQVVPAPDTSRRGAIGQLKNAVIWSAHQLKCLTRPNWHRSAYEGFQLKAVKRH